MRYQTDDIRISGMQELLPPEKLMEEQTISESSAKLVYESRIKISEIIVKFQKKQYIFGNVKKFLCFSPGFFEFSKVMVKLGKIFFVGDVQTHNISIQKYFGRLDVIVSSYFGFQFGTATETGSGYGTDHYFESFDVEYIEGSEHCVVVTDQKQEHGKGECKWQWQWQWQRKWKEQ